MNGFRRALFSLAKEPASKRQIMRRQNFVSFYLYSTPFTSISREKTLCNVVMIRLFF
jgi:hypothetical protein